MKESYVLENIHSDQCPSLISLQEESCSGLHCYRLYGLTVMSELEIPDAECVTLPVCDKAADVTIALGRVPDFITAENVIKLKDDWYFSVPAPQLFYMHCNGFGFEIKDGDTVNVDVYNQDVENSGLITYILGSAFGVVGIQRGSVPIHGAAVETGDTAAIITGHSGSGKSAVLGELIKTGRRYLADDVSMVFTVDGVPLVVPSYPQRKIVADSAAETGEDISGATLINEDGKDKYAIRKTSEWLDERRQLSCIVEIVSARKKDDSPFAPEIKEIKGQASLRLLLRNQFRPQFAAALGTPPQRMKQLLEVTSSVKTFQIIRPTEGFPVSDTARMVIEKCL